ncbi:Cobalt transporter subunit CbtB [Hyphomicrobiales bacterium]|nr:Cobalt transporter subunit CbtB [Hyphomicrobiales bacterium]
MKEVAVSNVAVAGLGSRAEVLKVALVAFAMGVALVFVTGFAHPEAVHNAAHDTRHALSFPCH